jgi:recombinational DNA repair protein RecT
MAKKTAFRRLAKWLPLSPEYREAVERDDDTPAEIRDVTPSRAPYDKEASDRAKAIIDAAPRVESIEDEAARKEAAEAKGE